jgi:hypothetical protein
MPGKPPAWESLRRKIAAHRAGLDYVVAQGLTRDAGTLAMLAELEEIAPEELGELVSFEKIRRADLRAVLDLARRRHLPLKVEPTDDAEPSVQAKPAGSGAHVDALAGAPAGTAGGGPSRTALPARPSHRCRTTQSLRTPPPARPTARRIELWRRQIGHLRPHPAHHRGSAGPLGRCSAAA